MKIKITSKGTGGIGNGVGIDALPAGPAGRRRRTVLFSDNPDARNTLADASRSMASKATTRSLALTAVEHSDIAVDLTTSDAIRDAAMAELSVAVTMPDLGGVVGLGSNGFSMEAAGEFKRIFTEGSLASSTWTEAAVKNVSEHFGTEYYGRFSARSFESYIKSQALLGATSFATAEVKWGLYSSAYGYAREASKTAMFASGAKILSYVGSRPVSIALDIAHGISDIRSNPSERNTSVVSGRMAGEIVADTGITYGTSKIIMGLGKTPMTFIGASVVAITADVLIHSVLGTVVGSFTGNLYDKGILRTESNEAFYDDMHKLTSRW